MSTSIESDLSLAASDILKFFSSHFGVPKAMDGNTEIVATTFIENKILDFYNSRMKQNYVPGLESTIYTDADFPNGSSALESFLNSRSVWKMKSSGASITRQHYPKGTTLTMHWMQNGTPAKITITLP